MVKDMRDDSEKAKPRVREDLTRIVKSVTDGAFDVVDSDNSTFFVDPSNDSDPELFIVKPSPPQEDADNELNELLGITGRYEDGSIIGVYIKSGKDITFGVQKGDNIAMKIAEAYEAEHGKDIITLKTVQIMNL